MITLDPKKALIFRITHITNGPWILNHGLHSHNEAFASGQASTSLRASMQRAFSAGVPTEIRIHSGSW